MITFHLPVNRRPKDCFSTFLYRQRNGIERRFGRLKVFPTHRHTA